MWKRPLHFGLVQEYETTRKELEGVKKEREEAKKQLSALKHAQAPMLRKIQLIDNKLQPIEAQIRAKVRKLILTFTVLYHTFTFWTELLTVVHIVSVSDLKADNDTDTVVQTAFMVCWQTCTQKAYLGINENEIWVH